MPESPAHSSSFHFHDSLEDFLARDATGPVRRYHFRGTPSVKDAIEAQGVPHPEVDVILAHGHPVDLAYLLQPGDQIEVYPVFARVQVPPSAHLQPLPRGEPRFALDVNLGKLARWLRLIGMDALYRNDFEDAELAELSSHEDRIILTRDRGLLFHKVISCGYYVRSDDPSLQIVEVVRRFALKSRMAVFRRCLECNGLIQPVSKEKVLSLLEPRTKRYYDSFYQCSSCQKVYWKGSHYAGIVEKLRALEDSSGS